MSRNKIIFLVALSILALMLFFVLIETINIINQAGQVEIQNNNNNNNYQQNIEISSKQSGDPLITPGSVLYDVLLKESDPIAGNKNSELRIIEFGDFQCIYCEQMYKTLVNIMSEYQKDIWLVWKDFPNPVHTEAMRSAIAARCAQNQGKFWEYHNYLFENQDNLSRELYNKIALELQLNLAEFNKCLDGKETASLVGDGLVDGQNIGVDATPYLIIGNSVYNYALTDEELRRVVKDKLGK